LNLNSNQEWIEWAKSDKRPEYIPYHPNQVYIDKWKGWGDWLGTGNIASQNRKFKSYEEVQKIAIDLGIDSKIAWFEYWKKHDRPKDIPSCPNKTYSDKWNGWTDWLKTNNKSYRQINKQFLSFEEAREYVRNLQLKSLTQWRKWAKSDKRPKYIPSSPHRTYSDQWIDWYDWLGKERPKK
jgi:hypothetical protein